MVQNLTLKVVEDLDGEMFGTQAVTGVSPAGGPIASDNFNRADGAMGANWTIVYDFGSVGIVSNQATNSGGNQAVVFWAGAGSFTDDQWSQATFSSASGNQAVAVRMSGTSFGTAKGYFLGINSSSGPTDRIKLYRMNADSTFTDVVNDASVATLANGDVLKLVVTFSGGVNTLTGYRNGAVISAINGITDSTLGTGGLPGLSIVSSVDDWSAGAP